MFLQHIDCITVAAFVETITIIQQFPLAPTCAALLSFFNASLGVLHFFVFTIIIIFLIRPKTKGKDHFLFLNNCIKNELFRCYFVIVLLLLMLKTVIAIQQYLIHQGSTLKTGIYVLLLALIAPFPDFARYLVKHLSLNG